MIDPIYAIPFFIAVTVVGYAIIFKFFIQAPFNGVRHVRNVFSKKVDSSTKVDSKEIVSEVGRGLTSFLIMMFSIIIGFIIVSAVGLLGIKILSWIALIGVGIILLLIYSWAQNRI